MKFKLQSQFSPAGDQPDAILQLVAGIEKGVKHQTLLGVTGSGKTFTMANVIEKVQLPTLILSHNKTLAAQLYQEFKEFFPENAVEYFVSFYDYYQPEAYLPATDTYIEKDSDINDEIDRLRLKATSSLLSRKDVILVASVSCIYNIGASEAYEAASFRIEAGREMKQKEFFKKLVDMQYRRTAGDLERGTFRVRGDNVEILPAYDEIPLRLAFFGDTVESIGLIERVSGKVITNLEGVHIFPARHYVTTNVSIENAIKQIYHELEDQLAIFRSQNKLVEAQRLEQRTNYDIEMIREVGYVSGIENYSRILDGREVGSKPNSLIDFFKAPYLMIIDESHVSVSQVRGMYNGDRARKQTLVDFGFRLPCALDNRPLKFDEFESLMDNVVYVSATPADYELEKSGGVFVEQVIRPTGLVDPEFEIKPATNQVDDLIEELRKVVEQGDRALVTTMTKKMAEDLSEYLGELKFRAKYLHADIVTIERSEILRDLRLGEFDILIGINLLREGLDLPEVALVAILDADKEGFLRSTRSLIQISGRAARNVNGRIILYADRITDSIQRALDETNRRRTKQVEYNRINNITPKSIVRKIGDHLVPGDTHTSEELAVAESSPEYGNKKRSGAPAKKKSNLDRAAEIVKLEKEMMEAAKRMEFEKAARLRDRIWELKG